MPLPRGAPCIQSGVCRLRNEVLSKPAAVALLSALALDAAGRPLTPPAAEVAAIPGANAPADGAAGTARVALGRARALQELMERTRRRSVMDRIGPATEPEPVRAQFSQGDRVELSPYGRGVVLASRLEGGREILTVRFAHRGAVREVDATRSAVKKVE